MKTYLLTGATGFIGHHLARRLLSEGHQVIATRRPQSNTAKLGELAGEIRWIDVGPAGAMEAALHRLPQVSAVLHLATAYGRGGQSVTEVLQSNMVFPLRLLEWAIEQEVELFVNTDTCFTPDYPYLRPYTLSKKQFSTWGGLVSEGTGTRFITLELQHPYGPGDGEGKFVPWIVDQCLHATGPIPLTSGQQQKDFIFVDDVISAYLHVCENWERLGAEVTTAACGSGQVVSIRDFVLCVWNACGGCATLNFGKLAQRPGEMMRSVADTTMLRSLGWKAEVSLEEGVARTVAAWRKHARRADKENFG